MHRDVTCTWSLIFSASNVPTAVLYSKASYVAFTRLIQQPHYATCFISSIGQLWGYGGLRDFLIDSGVYTFATVDQMLKV